MPVEPQPSAGPEQRLDAVVSDYLESVERGECADFRPWLERYPDLAAELGAFFADEARFGRLIAPLRNPSSSVSQASAPTIPSPGLLRIIGDYELLSEIGRGGMGVIYKARQKSLNRLVAIKMIRSAEWATPQERLRFRWEAEAIAALDHPNIVPIYEVGEFASDDGVQLPFFSMKLIEGDSLSEAQDRFRNDWKSIVRLMVLVSRAIEHAHQRGVLHRDLKPANILLQIANDPGPAGEVHQGTGVVVGTSFITPHISDFGLARRAEHQPGATVPGTIVGTPSYLAPELADGRQSATIASDVYSLGAVFYQMLTGIPPFHADTPLETIRLLSLTAVKPPCRVNSAVPPDLETICLKCLDTEAGKRYPSAGKLADELEHFLAGRPISARPAGSFERFRRWCRRQPAIAALSASLIVVVVASLPLIAWNWRRAVAHERLAEAHLEDAKKQRDRADSGFGLAHSAVEDIFRLLADDRWEQFPGSDQVKRELLNKGLSYYRAFVDDRRDDPKLRREIASALFRIGLISGKIGTKREAVDSFRHAIAVLRVLIQEYPDDAALEDMLGHSLTNLGNALSALNLLDEAIAAHEEAIEVWKHLPGDRPSARHGIKEQAAALSNRGVVLQGKEDWPAALDSFRRARSVLSDGRLAASEQELMVRILLNTSQAQDHLDRRGEALASAREAEAIADRRTRTAPLTDEWQFLMGMAARAVGGLQRRSGEIEDAKTHLERARQCLDGLYRAHPRVTDYSWNLSQVYEELAFLDEKQNSAKALTALQQAETLMLELAGRDEESHVNRSSLARVERRLARVYQDQGNTAAAAKALGRVKDQFEYMLEHGSTISTLRFDLAQTWQQLGVMQSRLGRQKDALAAAENAADLYRRLLAETPAELKVRKGLSGALGNIAIANRALRRLPEAISATEERAKLWPEGPSELYDAATDFARTADLASRPKEPSPELRDRAVRLAVATLQQALAAGWADRGKLRSDPVFAPIREANEFRKLLDPVEEKAQP